MMPQLCSLLLFFVLTISSAPAAAPAPAGIASPDLQWLNLGHYKKSLWGGYLSQVDGPAFFLSKQGKASPEEELKATMDAFMAPASLDHSQDDEHALCRFPARLLWLQRNHGLQGRQLPQVHCQKFERFKKTLDAKSVSLVFSSYYINNPSSSFGHSLLRFNKINRADPKAKRHYELLDYGINYAAVATTSNAFFYAISGLAGFFKGTFTNIPYYYKVREYNDYEARDVWSYDLNINADELEMLVAHVWELGPTWFDYYYLTENCSYHMLSVLDAAAPRLALVDKLAYWVLPADTIKVAYETPGLVTNVSYRASSRSQFKYRYEHLSQTEQKLLRQLADSPNFSKESDEAFKNVPLASQVAILDTASDYMEYKYPEDLLKQKSESANRKQQILVTRAKIPLPSSDVNFDPPALEMPHFGHGSARAGLGFGAEKDIGAFVQLSMRFALHDLLDPTQGYPEEAQIEFLHFEGRINTTQTLKTSKITKIVELQEATLFRVTSLNPISFANKSFSWRVDLGLRQIRDLNCDRCMAGRGEFGAGYTLEPWHHAPVRGFALLDGELSVSPSFEASAVRLGAGPRVGVLARLTNSMKWLTEGRYRYLAFSKFPHSYGFSSAFRYVHASTVGFELKASTETLSRDAAFLTYYYF